MSTIAVDAMGSDNAPISEIEGTVAAVRNSGVHVVLVGNEALIRANLDRLSALREPRIEIQHAGEVVSMTDPPKQVFRQKLDSSMRVAFDLVKKGTVEAVVSAGNSGAMLSHALLILGRLPGVVRPGIVTTLPTPSGFLTLCDAGANTDVKPAMLAQFGILGAYHNRVLSGRERPRIGVLSNGQELSKGTEITRKASALLARAATHQESAFEFIGYVEGSNLFEDSVDVVATDGFTGNISLKIAEGVSQAVIRMVKAQLASSVRAKLGAALVKPALQKLRQVIHYSEMGGGVLLGVKKLVMICHGRSSALAIANAISACDRFLTANLVSDLGAAISRHQEVWQPTGQKNGVEIAAVEKNAGVQVHASTERETCEER